MSICRHLLLPQKHIKHPPGKSEFSYLCAQTRHTRTQNCVTLRPRATHATAVRGVHQQITSIRASPACTARSMQDEKRTSAHTQQAARKTRDTPVVDAQFFSLLHFPLHQTHTHTHTCTADARGRATHARSIHNNPQKPVFHHPKHKKQKQTSA